MQGRIIEAKRDESENGTVTLTHGVFHRWLVSIEAGDKTEQADVLRKPRELPQDEDPTGLTAEYDGKRWKVAQKPGGGRDPKETKAIVRQHSEEMAIRAMALGHQIGVTTCQGPMDGDTFRQRLIAWTDFFEKDANG